MGEPVAVYLAFPSDVSKKLAAKGYEVLDTNGKLPSQVFPKEKLEKVRAAVSMGSGHNCNELMEDLPNLRMIACHGTGYDGVDLALARKKGVLIGNSPGANSYGVAEQAMTLMLAAMRNVVRCDAFLRSGEWGKTHRTGMPRPLGMNGTKIGIYGMGEIGQKIAARCAAFESDVQYFSRRKLDQLPYKYHDTLESLVEWCDVLHIAVRAGPETKHVINRAMFEKLGLDGYVVNIARGSVIDEDALIWALKNNIIAGAGLDVLQNEPDVRADLFDLPNVVYAPHQGGNTRQAHNAMHACAIENVEAYLAGRPIPYPVP